MTRDFPPEDADFYFGDPYPALRRVRREDPVHWYEPARCWCITKHADVEQSFTRHATRATSLRGKQIAEGDCLLLLYLEQGAPRNGAQPVALTGATSGEEPPIVAKRRAAQRPDLLAAAGRVGVDDGPRLARGREEPVVEQLRELRSRTPGSRNVRAELETILGEIYDSLARHRTAIKLVECCAPDFPELAKVWYRGGREPALSRLARYLDGRARRGRLRLFEDGAVAARIVLETLVFWAVHRYWDPSPHAVDEAYARRTVLAFLTAALVTEP